MPDLKSGLLWTRPTKRKSSLRPDRRNDVRAATPTRNAESMQAMNRILMLFLLFAGNASIAGTRADEIHEAARQGDVEVVSLLILEDRTLINRAEPNYGYTPLHIAIVRGDLDLVEVLVALGADLDVAARSGCSPLKLAIGLGKDQIADYLAEKGAQVAEPPRVVVIPPPLPLIIPQRPQPRPGSTDEGNSRLGNGLEHVGSQCEACGQPVPLNLGVGDRCPHCGVIWGGVRVKYLN